MLAFAPMYVSAQCLKIHSKDVVFEFLFSNKAWLKMGKKNRPL